jgi:hypothetical protein
VDIIVFYAIRLSDLEIAAEMPIVRLESCEQYEELVNLPFYLSPNALQRPATSLSICGKNLRK